MAEENRLTANSGIELLTFGTPNGFKASIMLEELKEAYGKDYNYQTIKIFANDQKQPWFTRFSPNGKIPVIVDHDKNGYAVMEGIAIVNYLTRHYDPDHKFSFVDPLHACDAEQWIAWQHGNLGPMQAQANFYYKFHANRYGHPTQRFVGEAEHLYGVLDARLADRDYIAGAGRGKYSITDIVLWPFADAVGVLGLELEKFPNVYGWWKRISERPAVRKGMTIPSGEPFKYGYELVQKQRLEDPQGAVESERPFKEALENAREEFA